MSDGYNYLNDCDDGTHWNSRSRWRCSCCGKHVHEMSQEHAPEEPKQEAIGPDDWPPLEDYNDGYTAEENLANAEDRATGRSWYWGG